MAWHAQPTRASHQARGRGRKMKYKTRETCAMNSVTSKHILTNESQHKRKLKLIVQRDNRHHQQPQQQQIWLFIRYIKGIKSKTIVRFTVDWFSWICPKKKWMSKRVWTVSRCICDIIDDVEWKKNEPNSNLIARTTFTSHITFDSLEFPWKSPLDREKERDECIIIQKSKHYNQCNVSIPGRIWMRLNWVRLNHTHRREEESWIWTTATKWNNETSREANKILNLKQNIHWKIM